MIITTAFNAKFAQIGEMCVDSIKRYCAAHPQTKHAIEIIPDDYPRPASWFKVGMIARLLPEHNFVLWIDADAMIVGGEDIEAMLAPVTLNICKDCNGANGGIVAWRNCAQSFEMLQRIEDSYERFKDGKWFEQHAIMELLPQIDFKMQPKEILNAYPVGVENPDANECSQIVHFPGMSIEQRIPLMKKFAA